MSALLEVKDLSKYFKTPNGLLHAVDHVSFDIKTQTTLGVVGESGCGKSTLGRAILALNEATGGQVIFDGVDITHPKGNTKKFLKKNMQIIFQDPYSSLDPRKSIRQLIAEPMRINHMCKSRAELDKRILEIVDIVGLPNRYLTSFPHELDGGCRQRVGIARALSINPRFIVCDEPVSALDVSIQAQVLNLMSDLQKDRSLSYIFITHNLSVVKHFSDEILVMYCGCMVEKAPTRSLFAMPLHPYTKGLLSAIPVPSLHVERKRVLLKGEITSPVNPAPGCRFCSRCEFATEECSRAMPPVEEIKPGHFVACYNARKISRV